MSQDWNPGGASPGDQGQGMPTWQPPGTMGPPGAQLASIPSRWPLAVISVLCFWPLGIAACVFAARVKPALQIGDVTGAVNASNKVRLFFWISLAVFVVYLLIIIGSSGSSSTG
jgi:Interferon-induced transmembrane protein